jgi:hypothetical protein
MSATRARQRCGSVLVRVEVPRTVIDGLVSAGVLSETERTKRTAIQRAVTRVPNALPPPCQGSEPVVPRTLAESGWGLRRREAPRACPDSWQPKPFAARGRPEADAAVARSVVVGCCAVTVDAGPLLGRRDA